MPSEIAAGCGEAALDIPLETGTRDTEGNKLGQELEEPDSGSRLRILVLTNLYPPHFIGGYELGCQDVTEALRDRGHIVEVLTSTYGIDSPSSASGVHRRLRTEWEAREACAPSRWEIFAQERINQRAMREVVQSFRPDVVYVWNLAQISLSILAMAENMGLPIAYYVSDEWLMNWAPAEHRWFAYWARQPRMRIAHVVKQIVHAFVNRAFGLNTGEGFSKRTRTLSYQNLQFASQFLRDITARAIDAGQKTWEVVRWGIDTEIFAPSEPSSPAGRRLLFVGQVLPHKGVHIAIEAVRIVREEFGFSDISLDIVGPTTVDMYVTELQALISSCALTGSVHLRGPVDRQYLPQIYQDHDVLIFPSMWQEPFSITLLEALSSQLPVVSTLTGGSGEILCPDVNALVFEVGNARDCAVQIVRLLSDQVFASSIAMAGRRTVTRRHTMRGMVDRVEAGLRRALVPK